MNAAVTLRHARRRAGLSQRALAERADTSHSTIAAYEAGRKAPSVTTFARLLRAAGAEVDGTLRDAVGGPDASERGRELIAVLELAAMFPAQHSSTLTAPVFPHPRPTPRRVRRAA
jgi:transcriptional regulator with XRE-family HTH domain